MSTVSVIDSIAQIITELRNGRSKKFGSHVIYDVSASIEQKYPLGISVNPNYGGELLLGKPFA